MAKVDLSKMAAMDVPALDWEITDVLDDVIMLELVDVDKTGEYIQRNGIMIKIDPSRQVWRVGRVHLAGPECSVKMKKGVHVLFPNNYGIHVPEVAGIKHVVFINEERIFGLCKPRK
jgi:hypothetical protein